MFPGYYALSEVKETGAFPEKVKLTSIIFRAEFATLAITGTSLTGLSYAVQNTRAIS